METITIPRRFWLFRTDTAKAKGGLLDQEPGSFNSVADAIEDFNGAYDFAQVGAVNPNTGELETVAWYDGGTWFGVRQPDYAVTAEPADHTEVH